MNDISFYDLPLVSLHLLSVFSYSSPSIPRSEPMKRCRYYDVYIICDEQKIVNQKRVLNRSHKIYSYLLFTLTPKSMATFRASQLQIMDNAIKPTRNRLTVDMITMDRNWSLNEK